MSNDIRLKKQTNSKFLINDDSDVKDDDFEIKKPSYSDEEDNVVNNSDDDNFDDDLIKGRLYSSDEEEQKDDYDDDNDSVRSSYNRADEDSDDVRKQKSFLLFKLKRLEAKNYPCSRLFTMDDELSKIKGEVDRITKEIDMTRGVEFSRQGLLFFTNGLEMMNNKFDPLDLQLDGWSETIAANIDSYDDVLEELYEKYHTKVAVAPEVKLIMMILGSAFMFHFSKSFAKKSENIANIFNNPDVMSSIGKAMANEAKNEAKNKSETKPVQNKMKGPDTNIDELLARLETESENGDDNIKSIPTTSASNKKRGRPAKKEKEEDLSSSIMLDI